MYYTMENFINYCDKMQIAEEGLFSKKLKPEQKEKIDKIKKENSDIENRMKAFMKDALSEIKSVCQNSLGCDTGSIDKLNAEYDLKAFGKPFVWGFKASIFFDGKSKQTAIDGRMSSLRKSLKSKLAKYKLTDRDLPSGTSIKFSLAGNTTQSIAAGLNTGNGWSYNSQHIDYELKLFLNLTK